MRKKVFGNPDNTFFYLFSLFTNNLTSHTFFKLYHCVLSLWRYSVMITEKIMAKLIVMCFQL